MKHKLTGNRYSMDLGVLKTELFFETDESMVFTVIDGGSLTENGIVYSNETLPDGSFYTMKGAICPI